jgi:tryptophanase
MFGHTDPETGREVPSRMELVRLAVPRRAYTESQIKYVIDVILAVWARRERIGGFRFAAQEPVLRHFTARFEPLYSMGT